LALSLKTATAPCLIGSCESARQRLPARCFLPASANTKAAGACLSEKTASQQFSALDQWLPKAGVYGCLSASCRQQTCMSAATRQRLPVCTFQPVAAFLLKSGRQLAAAICHAGAARQRLTASHSEAAKHWLPACQPGRACVSAMPFRQRLLESQRQHDIQWFMQGSELFAARATYISAIGLQLTYSNNGLPSCQAGAASKRLSALRLWLPTRSCLPASERLPASQLDTACLPVNDCVQASGSFPSHTFRPEVPCK
jgi:hypothetical protein